MDYTLHRFILYIFCSFNLTAPVTTNVSSCLPSVTTWGAKYQRGIAIPSFYFIILYSFSLGKRVKLKSGLWKQIDYRAGPLFTVSVYTVLQGLINWNGWALREGNLMKRAVVGGGYKCYVLKCSCEGMYCLYRFLHPLMLHLAKVGRVRKVYYS